MKQRLIDANQLHPTYHQGTYIGGGMYDGEGYTIDYEEIENAPTIEAIPVEWIKEKLKKEEYVPFVDYIEWSNCLCWLLEEWEEENETNAEC